jgi:hypothetical protein
MRRTDLFILVAGAGIMVTGAQGGHELPIYPSFYPHEITIKTLAPDEAADVLRKGEIQAFVGEGLSFPGAPPEHIAAVESLGAFVLARVNPKSSLITAPTSACDIMKAVVRELGSDSGFVLHPYPVTPFHGDYLYHSDLAAAAKEHLLRGEAAFAQPKIKASGSFARTHPEWSGDDWDVEITETDAADAMASEISSVNGRLGPPWLKTGWFNAVRLLSDADAAGKERIDATVRHLQAGDFVGLPERINLERDLVGALTQGCQRMVLGYTAKREYVNVEFSAGIENIGYDAIAGLASPMFIRTVKLKDFPWNGWLALGINGKPHAAWNPVGGMTDRFGQFLGFAAGDPALLPAPYDAGWMLNRISDLPPNWSP